MDDLGGMAIPQAQGILRERYGFDVDQAGAWLRGMAHDLHVSVARAAEVLVAEVEGRSTN